MKLLVLSAMLAGLLACTVLPAYAQDTTVEVQTWSGLSLRVAQPTVAVRYTLPPPSERGGGEAPAGPGGLPGAAAAVGATAGGGPEPQLVGSVSGLAKMFASGPEPIRAQRESETLTLFRGTTELRIPVANLASLTVTRQRVPDSPLPPYVAPTHVRPAAVAVLVDGSTIEGDYASFGTAVLTGITPQGRVEIPLDDVERLRFQR